MKVRCPAKINLYLYVLGKRPDGFHELETLMCPISLYDELTVEPADEVSLRLTGADISAGEDNLVMRAARLVQKLSGTTKGARLTLTKNIPAGGGLAGGSSDAAHTLRALNEFWRCGLSPAALDAAAATLGSDVNLFLHDSPAVCTGRGEKVAPVTLTEKPRVVLVNPGFGVPTPWAFKTYAAQPARGAEEKLTLHYRVGTGSVTAFKLRNDLEPAVFSKYLWLPAAKAWLAAQPGVTASMMSGSGATVFALTDDAAATVRVAGAARGHFGDGAFIRTAELLSGNLSG